MHMIRQLDSYDISQRNDIKGLISEVYVYAWSVTQIVGSIIKYNAQSTQKKDYATTSYIVCLYIESVYNSTNVLLYV